MRMVIKLLKVMLREALKSPLIYKESNMDEKDIEWEYKKTKVVVAVFIVAVFTVLYIFDL